MKVYILPEAMARMYAYTQIAEGEVSGYAEVEKTNGILLITKLYPLLEQVCSGAETVVDFDKFVEFVSKQPNENVPKIRCWWHSHVNGWTNFSGTDDETINSWGSQGIDYLISICVNKKREYTSRLDVFNPVQVTVPVELDQYFQLSKGAWEAFTKEINTKITKKVYHAPADGSGHKTWVKGDDGHWYPIIKKTLSSALDDSEEESWQERWENYKKTDDFDYYSEKNRQKRG